MEHSRNHREPTWRSSKSRSRGRGQVRSRWLHAVGLAARTSRCQSASSEQINFDPGAFVPVSLMVKLPTALVVNPKVPASNLQEFLAYARANPGKLTFGSPGVGSTPHLATEQLMKAAGIRLVHVPYQGMAPAMNDLMGGHIDMMIDLYGNVAGSIKEGKLRLLAVTTPERLPQEPAVPTISEAVPGFA